MAAKQGQLAKLACREHGTWSRVARRDAEDEEKINGEESPQSL